MNVEILVLTNGSTSLEWTMRSLDNQTVKRPVRVMKDMQVIDAMRAFISECETDYFVKVDDDFHLHPYAIEFLEWLLDLIPQSSLYVCNLWEPWARRFRRGIKVYQLEDLKNIPLRAKPGTGRIDRNYLNDLVEQNKKVVIDHSTVGIHSLREEEDRKKYTKLWGRRWRGSSWMKGTPIREKFTQEQQYNMLEEIPYHNTKSRFGDFIEQKHMPKTIKANMDNRTPWVMHLWKDFKRVQKSIATLDFSDLKIDISTVSGKQASRLWFKCLQSSAEISKVMEMLAGADVVLEIGLGWGATHFLLSKVAHEVISIDKKFSNLVLCSYIMKKVHKLDNSQFVTGDSTDVKTVEAVKKILGDRQLDAVYIDANHRYEYVMKDHDLYAPLVRDGGMVFFHDYVHEPGVHKAVDEIEKSHRDMRVIVGKGKLGTAWYVK